MLFYYTIAEAAELLNLTQNTVREYIKRGTLAAINLGIRKQRILCEEVDRYNRERRSPGPPPGRKMSDTTKKKLSEARKGDKNPFKGKRHTDETRAKMSAKQALAPRGENSPSWKGGRTTDQHGYIYVYAPDHPYRDRCYVPEHRLVMEQVIGRYLTPDEEVHHKNGIITDNRPENLEVMTTSEHMRFHRLNPHIRKRQG